MSHAPGPWRAIKEFANRWRIVRERPGMVALSVAVVTLSQCEVCVGDDDTNDANAEFIVRAANAHDDLLESLREAITWIDAESRGGEECLKQIEAAIAKATEPTP